ncbi:hypothetical protein [Xenococcus sp. PCC 7305]|uniref:hypothetical protein n=1 Tax=Xenococcus sp. PCC 7305 TaxID=102125 RepID=UPI001181AE5F|nr:hypothetical protein [Xenococcus sp. PCC 7305]
MRYSLQERFLGAFFGSVIGEQWQHQDIQEKISTEKLKPEQTPWLAVHQKLVAQIPLSWDLSLSWENWELNRAKKLTSSEIAIALLPIILYYHDNLTQLEFLLQQVIQDWKIPLSNIHGLLLWSTGISLALREKIAPEYLWKQLSVNSKFFASSAPYKLENLQTLFDRGLSITEVTEELSLVVSQDMLPFLLSLYCFYQTPENFLLAIKQAFRVDNTVSGLMALTGCLSGAHNSRIGLPVNWEKLCQRENDYQKIWQLASRVFATWSGVYLPGNNVTISAVVSTPQTFQTRSNLKIISQKEYELQ